MGYFIEYLIPLAIYAKENLLLTLQGITNDDLDISVDMLKHVTLPLLANFGVYNATIKVKQRGKISS